MKTILLRNNLELKRQTEVLFKTLQENQVVQELHPYKVWLEDLIARLNSKIDRNLFRLEQMEMIEAALEERSVEMDPMLYSLIPDILSETEAIAADVNVLSANYLSPIHRSIPSDRIGLKLIRWLHDAHPCSVNLPFAISDGVFSILPSLQTPTLYYLPSVDQRGLLYLPLFFHEFGHLLYAMHEPEMDELVKEFQIQIEDYLEDEAKGRPYLTQARIKRIVDTWYNWTQEFFCDAIGLTIGGTSYLHAFSHYFQTGGMTEFYLPLKELEERTHPVTFWRLQFLVQRAEALGLREDARLIGTEWEKLDRYYDYPLEFFGYFETAFKDPLYQKLNDMLVETDPCVFSSDTNTPVAILNEAWRRYYLEHESFGEWEQEAIKQFLG